MNYSSKFKSSGFRSKCKLCIEALQDHELQNIVTTDIEERIFEIFRENIFPFGNLSDKLCNSCFTKIQDIASFKKQIIQKQDQLRNVSQSFVTMKIKLEPEDSESIFFEDVDIKEEEESYEDMNKSQNIEEEFDVDAIETQIIKQEQLEEMIPEESNENQFQDETSPISRRPTKKDANHVSSVHKNVKIKMRHTDKSHLENHICKEPGCSRSFNCASQLKYHMGRAHSSKNFKCEYEGCRKAYGSAEILRTHALTSHLQLKTNCPSKSCKYKSNSKGTLKQHIKNRHKDLGFKEYQKLLETVKNMNFVKIQTN